MSQTPQMLDALKENESLSIAALMIRYSIKNPYSIADRLRKQGHKITIIDSMVKLEYTALQKLGKKICGVLLSLFP